MWYAVDEGQHLRFVDRGIRGREAMLIERRFTVPVLAQQVDRRIVLGVVDIEPHTAWFGSGQLSLLAEQFADLRDVGRIFDAEMNVEVEHGRGER